MNILKRMESRLRQSGEVMSRAGIRLFDGGFGAQHDMRNAIWRCLVCRHGDECRDWLAAGRTHVPGFCPNREIFERHVGPAAAGGRPATSDVGSRPAA